MCADKPNLAAPFLGSLLNPNSDAAAITAVVALPPCPGGVCFSTREAIGEFGADTTPSLPSVELSRDLSDRSTGQSETSVVVGSVLATSVGTTLEDMGSAAPWAT